MDFHEELAARPSPNSPTNRVEALGPDRLTGIRRRIVEGAYDSGDTATQVARRLLSSGDLD
ncbi:MAG TPA: hypothetical protein VMM77_05620 [Gemmatimonadaceae bacterium]|nr:hypothetical protein [Gemmatimonadaceae bacterium]